MNEHAKKLGKLAAGKPKNFSHEEIERRKKLLEKARAAKAEKRKKGGRPRKP